MPVLADSRTAGASLRGGHAVKLVGWGVDAGPDGPIDYWLVCRPASFTLMQNIL